MPAVNKYSIPVVRIKLVREGHVPGTRVRTAADAADVLAAHLEGTDRENFVVILLNTQNVIIGINTVTVGTLDASLVHPREVYKPAIVAGAAGIIVGHNHPSGEVVPSAEDRSVTQKLKQAGDIVGIELLDHVIIGDGTGRHSSFRDLGLL